VNLPGSCNVVLSQLRELKSAHANRLAGFEGTISRRRNGEENGWKRGERKERNSTEEQKAHQKYISGDGLGIYNVAN